MVNRHWCILCVLYLIIRRERIPCKHQTPKIWLDRFQPCLLSMCLAFLQHAFRLLWHFYLINYVDVLSIHLISKNFFFFRNSFLLSYNFFQFPQICKGIHKLPTHFAVLRKKIFSEIHLIQFTVLCESYLSSWRDMKP